VDLSPRRRETNIISVQLSVKINHFSDMPPSNISQLEHGCLICYGEGMLHCIPWLFFSGITIHEANLQGISLLKYY